LSVVQGRLRGPLHTPHHLPAEARLHLVERKRQPQLVQADHGGQRVTVHLIASRGTHRLWSLAPRPHSLGGVVGSRLAVVDVGTPPTNGRARWQLPPGLVWPVGPAWSVGLAWGGV